MTEAEWLACTDPKPMLEFVRDKVSDRKLRLFAVACCRNIRHCFTDARSSDALEVAERFADGMATDEERRSAEIAAKAATHDLYPSHEDWAALAVANAVSESGHDALNARLLAIRASGAFIAAKTTAFTAAEAADDEVDSTRTTKRTAERSWQAGLLREIVGPLLFHPIALDPAWLTWNDNTLVKIAQSIYGESAFDRMPILADALEEAGCDNTDIRDHCRQASEHVRGCWAVDVILGKE